MATENNMTTPSMEHKMNLLLVGPSGAGKSDTFCTILGELNFDDDWNKQPTVKSCSMATKSLLGYDVTVVDTPGLYGADDTDHVIGEIRRSFSMVPSGFTSIVFVIQLGRVTEEIEKSIRQLHEIFGDHSNNYITIIFTHKDQLQSGRGKKTVEQYLHGLQDNELRRLLEDCGNRYVAFDNMQELQSDACLQQVEKLLGMLQKLPGGRSRYYTSAMMEEAKIKMRERQEQEEREAIRKSEERNRQLRLEVENEMAQQRTTRGKVSIVDLPASGSSRIAGNGNEGYWRKMWQKYRKKVLFLTLVVVVVLAAKCLLDIVVLLRNNSALTSEYDFFYNF